MLMERNDGKPTAEEVKTALDEATRLGSIALQMEDPARSGSARENAVRAKISLGELIANAETDVLRRVLGNGKSETDRNSS